MDRTSQRMMALDPYVTKVIGQAEWTAPGTYVWTCPPGVYEVSAVAVGAGRATGDQNAGGGLGWRKTIKVVPGQIYAVQVGSATTGDGMSFFISELTVCGRRGTTIGGTYVGDGGGNGGNGGKGGDGINGYYGAGAGGAGGYAGKGGNGGNGQPSAASSGVPQNGTAGETGAGGGGGGGGGAYYTNSSNQENHYAGAGAGGVGIYGQGANGLGGVGGTSASTTGKHGNGGSSGAPGAEGGAAGPEARAGGNGGAYGAGAGIGGARLVDGVTTLYSTAGVAQGGAVRIIYGEGRYYPSTRTANE